MSFAKTTIVGRITKDVELKYTPVGTPVANFSVAVDEDVTPKEDQEKHTDFYNVTLWEKQAEFASKYLSKGRLVLVDGRMKQRSYISKETGQKITVWDLIGHKIQGLDRKPEGSPAGEGTPVAAAPGAAADFEEEGDPFADN